MPKSALACRRVLDFKCHSDILYDVCRPTPTTPRQGFLDLLAGVATPAVSHSLPEYAEELARFLALQESPVQLCTPRARYDPRVLMFVDESAVEDNELSPM